MHISEFDYDLPEELIAQAPLAERDSSRMLVLDRKAQTWSDSSFQTFTNYLTANDVVVVNNTRVIPARLLGRRRGSGGRVEVLLLRRLTGESWEVLVRPGGRLRPGTIVEFGHDFAAEILDEPGVELRHVRFITEGTFEDALNKVGLTPLPPYIKRNESSNNDRERYQTVYAQHNGAIAAPTAGLHITSRVLSEIRARANLAEITLHVGYGTFEPVRVDDVAAHSVSTETFEIRDATAQLLNNLRGKGGRVIAVGTTTVRAIESSVDEQRQIVAQTGTASLTITPGYNFRAVDALLTNFHLPRSSLLLLVSAFAGKDLVLAAYKHAVKERYRFYSYGDCMLIL